MSTGRIDWADTGLRIEDTDLTRDQVDLLLPDDLTAWTSAEVAQWIRSLNPTFGPEAAIFDDEGIDGEMLLTLDDNIMKEELSIVSTLHRKKILSNIQKKKQEWDKKYGTPEVVEEPPPPEEPKTKRKTSKKKKSSKTKPSSSSKSKSKASKSKSKTSSSSKSKRSAASSKKKAGGKKGGATLADATLSESRCIEYLKWAGCSRMDKDLKTFFKYIDSKNRGQIAGKDLRKSIVRFIPGKAKIEKIRQKIAKKVNENKIESKWKEFVKEHGADEEEEESEEEEVQAKPTKKKSPTKNDDPNYDDFYDSPFIPEEEVSPYQLQLDNDRQTTIILAQKNRILELEAQLDKELELHEMQLSQIDDEHRSQLKDAEKHMEVQLQNLREKHLQELGGVRDRAKNLKDLHKQTKMSSTSVDGLDQQAQINSELRAQVKSLQKELETAKEFLDTSADEELMKVRAQLDTAVDMIAAKERALVQITKEKDDLMDMCRNLTMQLVNNTGPSGTQRRRRPSTLAHTQQKLRKLALTPSQAEVRSRDEITAALKQEAIRHEVQKKPKTKHVRGESITDFKQRLSLLVNATGADGGGAADLEPSSPTPGFDSAFLASDEMNSSFLRDD